MTDTATVKPLKVADPFGLARKTQGHKKAHEKSAFTLNQWDNMVKMSPQTLKIQPHGGGCCGVKHVMNFPAYDIMWELELEKRLAAYIKAYPGQTYEAILINGQADAKDYAWTKALLKLGFKLASDNRNSNSNNENFVFLLTTRPLGKRNVHLNHIRKLQKEMEKENVDN